jgi:hypothetical protein
MRRCKEPSQTVSQLFDRQIQVRVGQANVHRWTQRILPLLEDGDPLSVDSLTTHRMPLD